MSGGALSQRAALKLAFLKGGFTSGPIFRLMVLGAKLAGHHSRRSRDIGEYHGYRNRHDQAPAGHHPKYHPEEADFSKPVVDEW